MAPISTSWETIRNQARERARYCCAFCRKPESEVGKRGLHGHHIWPREFGGKDTIPNVVALCPKCHSNLESWTRAHIRGIEDEGIARAVVKYEASKRRHRDVIGAVTKQFVASSILQSRSRGHYELYSE